MFGKFSKIVSVQSCNAQLKNQFQLHPASGMHLKETFPKNLALRRHATQQLPRKDLDLKKMLEQVLENVTNSIEKVREFGNCMSQPASLPFNHPPRSWSPPTHFQRARQTQTDVGPCGIIQDSKNSPQNSLVGLDPIDISCSSGSWMRTHPQSQP